MTTEPPSTVRIKDHLPTLLGCDECEVTWRDQPGAPCWLCGDAGHVVSPERLVLD